MNKEIILNINNSELCTQTFGNSEDPAILLMMGASASMIWWDDEFCEMLADNKKFVIRYDNRDVGKSTTYAPGTINYNVMDLADDALRILDYYKITKAHLVGMSLGGMLAQILAIRNPERVLSITAISSGVWDHRPDLPSLDQRVLDNIAKSSSIDWTNKQEVIDFQVNGLKIQYGSKYPFNEERARKLISTDHERANNSLSMFNHAMLKGGEDLYGKSNQIKISTLIIHGSEDPVLPFPHAQAIADAIPNSRLIKLEGRGHEINPNDWNLIVDEIIKHTN